MVGAWDTGLESRMNTSAAGLLAVRVAMAAARRRSGSTLNERDLLVLSEVREDLAGEAQVLRSESSPDLDRETAYAFAGFALNALNQHRSASSSAEQPWANDLEGSEQAASRLDALAADLKSVSDDPEVSTETLERIESVFLAASVLVSSSLGRTGEVSTGISGAMKELQ